MNVRVCVFVIASMSSTGCALVPGGTTVQKVIDVLAPGYEKARRLESNRLAAMSLRKRPFTERVMRVHCRETSAEERAAMYTYDVQDVVTCLDTGMSISIPSKGYLDCLSGIVRGAGERFAIDATPPFECVPAMELSYMKYGIPFVPGGW
jgi:hypothetical protein